MNMLYVDYVQVQKVIDEITGFQCKNFKSEVESQEYSAATFEINNIRIVFRVAKITPTKIGQFVIFWKRINNGPIMPFDRLDEFDFLMVYVRSQGYTGLFIFPKSVLFSKDMISQHGNGGKRALRVYPSWDITDNKQARATQAWQLRYFIEFDSNGFCDTTALQKLLSDSL